jgi:hypothetical protein
MTNQNASTEITTTTGQSVAERAAAAVAMPKISAGDLALPQLMVAQSTTRAVQDGLVKPGALFVTIDRDDPEPKTLFTPGAKKLPVGIVLNITRWTHWNFTRDDGTTAYGEVPEGHEVPEEAVDYTRVQYNLVLLVPAYSDRLPVLLKLRSTSTAIARRIMTEARIVEPAPPWSFGFKLSTLQRQNDKGRWFVPQAVPTKISDEEITKAATIALAVNANQPEPESEIPLDDSDLAKPTPWEVGEAQEKAADAAEKAKLDAKYGDTLPE